MNYLIEEITTPRLDLYNFHDCTFSKLTAILVHIDHFFAIWLYINLLKTEKIQIRSVVMKELTRSLEHEVRGEVEDEGDHMEKVSWHG